MSRTNQLGAGDERPRVDRVHRGWTNGVASCAVVSLVACANRAASAVSSGTVDAGHGSVTAPPGQAADASSLTEDDAETVESGVTGDATASPGDGATGMTTFTDDELTAQGCALNRPAVAYRAGTSASSPASAPEPLIPCFSPTGFGGQESSIGIARDGTVFLAPAYSPNGNGLARTSDYGKTWTQIVPGGHGRVQPFLYLDPATDRVLFATSTLNAPDAGSATGFDLSWSADEGATWNTQLIAPDVRDWIKIYAGPAVTSTTQGYPNAIYASAPSPISTPDTVIFPAPSYQAVYQSLNGGETWTEVSMGALTLVPSTAASSGITSSTTCPSSEWIIYGDGLVGSDGTVYIGLRLCTTVGVAISKDEGQSWDVVTVPGSSLPAFTGLLSPVTTNNLLVSEPLALDATGNLYVIWNDENGALRLSIMSGGGQTWSGANPLVISAPGVTSAIESAIAVRAPGIVAIAYYGSTNGTQYNGYVAESLDALDPEPVFSSAIVNDPSDPLFSNGFDNNYLLTIGFGDLDELVQVKYAPGGDIWATFVKEMCVNTVTSNCTWDYAAHANSVFQGAAGRLVHQVVTDDDASEGGVPSSADAEAP
jgi:hypothetical protein